jgi:hypothetical protein
MDVLAPAGETAAESDGEGIAVAEAVVPSGAAPTTPPDELASPVLTGAAAFLAVAAAGWMAAGVFHGGLARAVAVLGALVGAGLITLSYRTSRPLLVQALAGPAAVVVGALLVLPFANGRSANLPALVVDAVHSGGIAQPPIPFDPGWRFILLVLVALAGATAAALATGLNRPKLGILIPAPLLFGAALVQPPGATLTSAAPALVLFIASFAVAFGVDLGREGATSGGFEVRRFTRSAGVLALLAVALVGLSHLGFLFPDPNNDKVIPPKRPEVPPAAPDRVLFTVKMARQLPIRLGVLDVYRDVAWLTPPFDSRRLVEVPPSGRIPAPAVPAGPAGPAGAPGLVATFTVQDIGGHLLPDVANPARVPHGGFAVKYDPRTQTLRLPDARAAAGMRYTVETPALPDAKQLQSAGPPGPALKEYLAVPPAPPAVAEILQAAPTTNAFDRLQFVRNAYYQRVVASGPGNPVDVPPSRVAQLLDGKPASPYEITAAEVLMARWAGVPARFGYGYFGGDNVGPDTFSIRPRNGATWLEAYFEGSGWVPILGTPPRALASLRPEQKNKNPAVRPTGDVAVLVYVPVKLQTIQLLYVVVRYWLLRAVPIAAGLVLVLAFYPGVLKLLRRQRRRRWAGRLGPGPRIAVAYTEFRDLMNDLNVGDPSLTPLELLKRVAPDAEHREMAWLVTRAMWGDLRRDIRTEDAEAAEDMAASVGRRVFRASPAINRVVAFGSRTSLRDPYSDDLPNLWPRWAPRARLRTMVGAVASARRRVRRLRRATAPGVS